MKPPHHLWQHLYQFWLVQSQLYQAMLWNTPGAFFQLLLTQWRTPIQNVFQDTDKNCTVEDKHDIILLLLSLIYLPSSVSLPSPCVSLYLYLCLPLESFLSISFKMNLCKANRGKWKNAGSHWESNPGPYIGCLVMSEAFSTIHAVYRGLWKCWSMMAVWL